jgi:hypothetical protein
MEDLLDSVNLGDLARSGAVAAATVYSEQLTKALRSPEAVLSGLPVCVDDVVCAYQSLLRSSQYLPPGPRNAVTGVVAQEILNYGEAPRNSLLGRVQATLGA